MKPVNLDDQLSAARLLSNSVQFGMSSDARWPTIEAAGQCEVAVNLIDAALRRLTYVEMARVPADQHARFAAGMAAMLGAHVGRVLRGLPADLVQLAVAETSRQLLAGIGADPDQSSVNVTVSSANQKEPLH